MLPIEITSDDVKEKYLKKRKPVRHKEIHPKHSIGIINGLWANAMGQGGIIPIQCNYFPTGTFGFEINWYARRCNERKYECSKNTWLSINTN